jgi:hypothetical protein
MIRIKIFYFNKYFLFLHVLVCFWISFYIWWFLDNYSTLEIVSVFGYVSTIIHLESTFNLFNYLFISILSCNLIISDIYFYYCVNICLAFAYLIDSISVSKSISSSNSPVFTGRVSIRSLYFLLYSMTD